MLQGLHCNMQGEKKMFGALSWTRQGLEVRGGGGLTEEKSFWEDACKPKVLKGFFFFVHLLLK